MDQDLEKNMVLEFLCVCLTSRRVLPNDKIDDLLLLRIY